MNSKKRLAVKSIKGAVNSSPFPQRIPFAVTFGDWYPLNGGSGIVVQSFRMNSLFDPDVTGVGGTPTYVAQLAEVYKTYIVESIDVDVNFVQYDTADISMCGITWHPSGESPVSSITQIQQLAMEGRQSKYLIMPPVLTGPAVEKRLHVHLDIKKIEGLSQLLQDYYGNFGANPVNSMGLDVWSICPNGVADQGMLSEVKITYYGHAFGRLALTYTD